MSDRYYAACCQTDFPCPGDRDEIAERTRRMCAIAEQTIVGYEPFHDVRLLVFPEFAHAAPIYDSVETLEQTVPETEPGSEPSAAAATLVIGTHRAAEADLAATVAALTSSSVVHRIASVLRVEGLS